MMRVRFSLPAPTYYGVIMDFNVIVNDISTYDLIDKISEVSWQFVERNARRVDAADLGLDERCGALYVTEDAIICHSGNDGRLQYYGGFEYVDRENRHVIGDFVFYMADDDRVTSHLSYSENGEF